MGLFPQQGVELLKTLLSYHLSLNKLIQRSSNIHRLPICLDAIFKEDVTDENKKAILRFIYKHKPTDTQTILSIAESQQSELKVTDFNAQIFENNANLIAIGYNARCLLKSVIDDKLILLSDTINIITS